MKRTQIWLAACGMCMLLGACDSLAYTQKLTADQIVTKNIVACGGEDAWHHVQTMVWSGYIASKHSPVSRLPFVLEMKRPDKTRFEIRAQGQVAIRIFDGNHGWKLRPARGGEPGLFPYNKYELQYARDAEGIGGPLLDYKSRSESVVLEGMDKVDGRKAYRLQLTLASGTTHHLWIDAENYLILKYERMARNKFGMTGKVYVYYSHYKTIDKVKLPTRIETGTDQRASRDVMVLDKVVINPKLPDWVFSKPIMPPHPPTVAIGGQSSPMGPRMLYQHMPGHGPGGAHE